MNKAQSNILIFLASALVGAAIYWLIVTSTVDSNKQEYEDKLSKVQKEKDSILNLYESVSGITDSLVIANEELEQKWLSFKNKSSIIEKKYDQIRYTNRNLSDDEHVKLLADRLSKKDSTQ